VSACTCTEFCIYRSGVLSRLKSLRLQPTCTIKPTSVVAAAHTLRRSVILSASCRDGGDHVLISNALSKDGEVCEIVNGTFCLTSGTHNGRPLYSKRGDADIWLLYSSAEEWLVTDTEDKDKNSGDGYAWGAFQMALPTDEKEWGNDEDEVATCSVEPVLVSSAHQSRPSAPRSCCPVHTTSCGCILLAQTWPARPSFLPY
jgi:hypothetical protein